jgi:hypothetical protein
MLNESNLQSDPILPTYARCKIEDFIVTSTIQAIKNGQLYQL